MRFQRKYFLFAVLCLIVVLSSCENTGESYSKKGSVYPGNPDENFSPRLIRDDNNYRNIAKNRAAYHSSSYDYNLTAQLVTDGIIEAEEPGFIIVNSSNGILPKREREKIFDHNIVTSLSFKGNDIFIELDEKGNYPARKVDAISITGTAILDNLKGGDWQIQCLGSVDGENWKPIKTKTGYGNIGEIRQMVASSKKGLNNLRKPRNPYGDSANDPKPTYTRNRKPIQHRSIINETFRLDTPVNYCYYKLKLSAPNVKEWHISNWDFYSGENKLKIAPSDIFTSAWMSEGIEREWVYVDFGFVSSFDLIKLFWVQKPNVYKIQLSDNAKDWEDLLTVPNNVGTDDELKLKTTAHSRYVRVYIPNAGKRCVLSELEVYGKGGAATVPAQKPKIESNRMELSGGNWKIQRSSEVSDDGETISTKDFVTTNWLTATVPGTVLVSYLNAGAIPDPDFSDNQLMISESFFYSDFWYRTTFDVPEQFSAPKTFLNFDGINWKADVFFNGKKVGKIEGAFIRGKFDITDLIVPGKKNVLAVLIHKNDNPGIVKEQTQASPDLNGGVLGADNPTFHASIGWDWIPTIRGRNIGIWNEVYLSTNGGVEIENPFITSDLPLPDTTSADVDIKLNVVNHTAEAVTGVLKGRFGDISLSKDVVLSPNESKIVEFNSKDYPALHLKNPRLWWPKGYGAPNLYDVELSFLSQEGISDKKTFKTGIREMSYSNKNEVLSLYINGRRFVGRGGNWGFSESNLRYRSREYDIAVALHADMNFTMIRNWVGQIGDEELYEACDRHGIMIWQDFWLANPSDGPNPNDNRMFMNNAKDMVTKIRNHPCIALYCGRNEGNPPAELDTALRKLTQKVHPGILYISHSSRGSVSGEGPYRALPVRDYFLLYGFDKFHSERGMPNVMTFESLKKTLPEDKLWPQNRLWGIHDYCLEGAQRAASFNQMIEKAFGKINDAKTFTEMAQWINYNGYRGLFEGRSLYRKGMLLWMSHSAWPSMVWQTYDYYFGPTAAYFGCKKACEPIHVQWNPVFNFIEVVNYSGGNRSGLKVKAQILNMDGTVQWETEAIVDSKEDSTVQPFQLKFPQILSEVHFIKLSLEENGKNISNNFYWRSLVEGNYQALNELPKINLSTNTSSIKTGSIWNLKTTIKNLTNTPALMVRLKVVGSKNKERILPVFYSDNYVFLMPGEEKTINMSLQDEDTEGEEPEVEIMGFNILPTKQ